MKTLVVQIALFDPYCIVFIFSKKTLVFRKKIMLLNVLPSLRIMKGFHSRTVSTSSVPCRFDLLSHIAGSFTVRAPVEGSHSPTFCSIIWEKLQQF